MLHSILFISQWALGIIRYKRKYFGMHFSTDFFLFFLAEGTSNIHIRHWIECYYILNTLLGDHNFPQEGQICKGTGLFQKILLRCLCQVFEARHRGAWDKLPWQVCYLQTKVLQISCSPLPSFSHRATHWSQEIKAKLKLSTI